MKNKFYNRSVGIHKLLSLPSLVISVSMFIIILLNFQQMKSQLQTNAVSQLNRFAVMSEKNIQNSISLSYSLYYNTVLSSALTSSEEWSENSGSIAKELKLFHSNHDLIDSVFIYNQKTNQVVSEDGFFTDSDFFTDNYHYYNYSTNYWNNYIFYDSSSYAVLSPSYVQKNGTESQIIPVILRKAYNLNFKQKTLLVLNIDINKLFSADSLPEITDNTSVFMLNKYTNDLFCPIKNSEYVPQLTSEFMHELLIGTSNIFKYKVNGETTTIATYSLTDSLSGYTYFAVIPHRDITKIIIPSQLIVCIIAFLFLLISFALIVRGARKISTPILSVISATQDEAPTTEYQQKDILDMLKTSASRIIDENRFLRMTLPCAQEKFLISFLNSTENYIDSKTRDKLISSLPFKYLYFSVVIIRLCPTVKFTDTYNSLEYSNIQLGFFDIIKDLFSADYNSFVIPGKSDEMYIILNTENDACRSDIEKILVKISKLLEFDHEYITLAIGQSNIHKELSGLKTAHKEATESLNTVTLSDISKVNSISINENEINFNFTPEEERQFLRTLTTEPVQSAKSVLESVLNANIGTNARSMRQLYNQILNIILKAMKIKGIPTETPEKADFEFSYDILSSPLPDIYNKIMSLLDYIGETDKSSVSSRLQISQKVIEYIEDNFSNSSMSLEFLSDYFNYTSANISAMIKSSLNIGFHQYLTELRVEKAKELLTETNMPVSRICNECGFNSQQTFYRAFKKIVGITSGEYRSQNRNKTETKLNKTEQNETTGADI